ncbi:MAG: SpoVT/AbrB domain protein [Bryobacterales bacterium]|nr:SpoVT/AbrB domain protein [Bryobacterales bacterium]
MATTKVFRSGNSQAARIPRQFQFDADEVEIQQRGEELVLRKRAKTLAGAFDLLTALSPDMFRGGRKQPKVQKRRTL